MNLQQDLPLGERLKEEGMTLVAAHNIPWKDSVAPVVLEMARERETFTSDDVRLRCQALNLPEPDHWNAWGAVMSAVAKSGQIRKTGYRKSELPNAHARIVAIWSKSQPE